MYELKQPKRGSWQAICLYLQLGSYVTTEKRTMIEKRNLLFNVLRICLALAIALLLTRFPFDFLEALTYDARFRLSPATKPSGIISIVAIDRTTIEILKREPNARDHQQLLKSLSEDAPHSIVYLMSPADLVGSFDDLKNLAATIKKIPNFYMALNEVPIKGEEDKLVLPVPFDDITVVPGPVIKDIHSFADDQVTRRAELSYENKLLLHPLLAQPFNHIIHAKDYRGIFERGKSRQLYVDFRPPGAYPQVSFMTAFETRYPKGTFTNKIILIGRHTQTDDQDYAMTPHSRYSLTMSFPEIHANILDTLILNTGVKQAPLWINILLTCLISILTVFVVFRLSPIRGLLLLIVTGLSFSVLSYGAFAFFRYWIGMVHPLLAIFICYYFFIPYRLIRESRKGWEYQQKNKLLMQVEELKSNFLSMMSHDLKTPIARIQGMTDMALQHPTNLSEDQKEALLTINRSSEELSVFISSILDLSRIESQKIKLNLQSKDVNVILEDVIKKYEFLAKSKNIEIIREFEPLFSIPLDSELMHQVFGNLIENAIKYSSENSKILVSTEESDNQVLIQVADQGMGISDSELNNIFMKFYRSKQAKNSPAKGSGLGLYLARYFVELHKGHIAVESVLNQGSTFTVELPMNNLH